MSMQKSEINSGWKTRVPFVDSGHVKGKFLCYFFLFINVHLINKNPLTFQKNCCKKVIKNTILHTLKFTPLIFVVVTVFKRKVVFGFNMKRLLALWFMCLLSHWILSICENLNYGTWKLFEPPDTRKDSYLHSLTSFQHSYIPHCYTVETG